MKNRIALVVLILVSLVAILLSFSIVQAQPQSPVLISPANGATIIIPTFSWQAETGASYYEIQVADNNGFSPYLWQETTYDLTITRYDALPHGLYYWRVRSYDSSETPGNWSAYRSYTKHIPAPETTSPTAGAMVIQPNFQWKAVEGAADYSIQVAQDAGFTSMEWEETTFDLTITPMSNLTNRLLYWRVAGRDANRVVGDYSSGVSFTKYIPAPVISLPESGAEIVTPTFSWQAVDGAVNFRIQVANDVAFTSLVWEETTYDLFITPFSTLPTGVLYWRVGGLDAAGNLGLYSPVRSFTKILPAPALVSPANNASVEIPRFAWQASEGAVRYEVKVARDSAFTSIAWEEITYDLTITPIDNAIFTAGDYWWRVTPQDAKDYAGTTSAVRKLTITAPAVCSQTNLVLSAPTDGATVTADPNFEWGCLQGANRYKLLIYQDSTQLAYSYTDYTVYTPYYFASYNKETLLNSAYTWKVEAYNNTTLLATSAARSFTKAASFSLLEPAEGATLASDPNFTWQPLESAKDYTLTIYQGVTQYAYFYAQYNALTPYYFASYNHETLPNGTYSWKVEARASNDQVIAFTEARTFTKSVPLTLQEPAGDTTLPVDPTFSWLPVEGARDYKLSIYQESVLLAYYYSDYTTHTPYYFASFNDETLLNGDFTWKVEARDNTQTVITTSETRTFTKATNQPLIAPPNYATLPSDPTFQWQATLGALRYKLLIYKDGVLYAYDYVDYPIFTPYYHASYNKETLPNGVYTWKIEALDNYDNAITTSEVWTFTIGPVTPTPTNTPIGGIPTRTPTPTPTPGPDPAITLDRADGCAGISVQVQGINFPYDPYQGIGNVLIRYAGIEVGSAQVNEDGTFTSWFSVPAGVGTGGVNTVTAVDSVLTNAQASATLRTPRTGLPVIFIPGVSGSRLIAYNFFTNVASPNWDLFPEEKGAILPEPHFYFTGEVIWLASNGVEEAVTGRSRYFDVIGLRSDGSSTDFPEVDVNDVLWEVDVPGAYKDIYQGFRNFMTSSLGYVEGTTFFPFPYDWRKDISITAADLEGTINEAILSSGQDLATGKVIIVAHSMGGLVARNYLINYGVNKVDQVISIGTPYLGSPKLLKVLETGDSWGVGKTVLGAWFGLQPMEVRKLAQNFPSAYELMPSQGWFNTDPIDPTYDPRYFYYNGAVQSFAQTRNFIRSRHNATLFDMAETFQQQGVADMSFLTESYFAQRIIGVGIDTIGKIHYTPPRQLCAWGYCITIRDEEIVPEWNVKGDETVPLHSAMGTNLRPGDSRYYFVADVSHVSMPNNSQVQSYVSQMLAGNLCSNYQTNLTNGVNAPQPPKPPVYSSGMQVTAFGGVTLRICNAAGDCADPEPIQTFGSRTTLSEVNAMPLKNGATAMITGSGNYTVYLRGAQAGSAAMLRLSQVQDGQTTQTLVFETIPITTTTAATVTLELGSLPTDLKLDFQYDSSSAVQQAGVFGKLSGTASYDITPPKVSFNVNLTTRLVTLSAQDEAGGSGVRSIYYSVGTMPGQYQLYTGPFTLSTGSLVIWAYATDQASNTSAPVYFPPYRLVLPAMRR